MKKVEKRVVGETQRIPYIIHQTNEEDMMPADMVMAVESTVEHNP